MDDGIYVLSLWRLLGNGFFKESVFTGYGSMVCRHYTHAAQNAIISSHVSSVDYLEAGDTVNSQVKQDSGGSLDLETRQYATYAHIIKIE